MCAFYRVWPIDKIFQTPSGKSSILGILSALPGKGLPAATTRGSTRSGDDLSALTSAFPLPWSAYTCLLSLKDEAARRFYETEALRCGWSVRQLQRQINSRFYERTALSKNKRAMLESGEQVGAGENPPVGLIICAAKGSAEAHYALDGLPNRVLAAEYRTVLPDEETLAQELERTRYEIEVRRNTDNSHRPESRS
jgi:hypothetical protein